MANLISVFKTTLLLIVITLSVALELYAEPVKKPSQERAYKFLTHKQFDNYEIQDSLLKQEFGIFHQQLLNDLAKDPNLITTDSDATHIYSLQFSLFHELPMYLHKTKFPVVDVMDKVHLKSSNASGSLKAEIVKKYYTKVIPMSKGNMTGLYIYQHQALPEFISDEVILQLPFDQTETQNQLRSCFDSEADWKQIKTEQNQDCLRIFADHQIYSEDLPQKKEIQKTLKLANDKYQSHDQAPYLKILVANANEKETIRIWNIQMTGFREFNQKPLAAIVDELKRLPFPKTIPPEDEAPKTETEITKFVAENPLIVELKGKSLVSELKERLSPDDIKYLQNLCKEKAQKDSCSWIEIRQADIVAPEDRKRITKIIKNLVVADRSATHSSFAFMGSHKYSEDDWKLYARVGRFAGALQVTLSQQFRLKELKQGKKSGPVVTIHDLGGKALELKAGKYPLRDRKGNLSLNFSGEMALRQAIGENSTPFSFYPLTEQAENITNGITNYLRTWQPGYFGLALSYFASEKLRIQGAWQMGIDLSVLETSYTLDTYQYQSKDTVLGFGTNLKGGFQYQLFRKTGIEGMLGGSLGVHAGWSSIGKNADLLFFLLPIVELNFALNY